MAHTGGEINGFAEPMLLAVETATMCGSVGLVTGQGCIGEVSLNSRLTHSRRLLNNVEILMQDTGVSWNDIDGLAISMGPGSFTGLRIGLSTAKGLAMAAEKPMVGVGTLAAMAAQFSMTEGLICPVLDARKKEVYSALFRSSGDGKVEKLTDDLAISPADLCTMLQEPVIMVGDGLSVYGDFFQEQLGDLLIKAPAQLYYPRASAVGMLGLEKWMNNDFLDLAASVPTYVRPSEAEIYFKG
jgi:tRNA threonylcarbamoyladenosine biosynthesis protein TsaB